MTARNKDTLKKIGQFAAEVTGRAEAVKELQEIAHQHPDLFEQFASFLANGHEDTAEQELPLVQPTQAIKEYLLVHPGAFAGGGV